MHVTAEDISAVSSLLIDLCGIYLDDTKGYLIESRLSDLVKEYKCSNYTELINKVRYSSDATLRNQVIDAVTTNETLFFRDESPFQALGEEILPELIGAKRGTPQHRRLRIWSAASSTGQEPYSIAATLVETIPDILGWDISIFATDISDAAISRASAGRYAKHEVQRGLPTEMLNKYFVPHGDGWQVKDELRGMVSYERRNLLDPFFNLGPFDIVFCRNVAIYFTEETRRSLFYRLSDTLTPGGYLFVGSSESLLDLGENFTPRYCGRASFYQPNAKGALLAAT